MEVTIVLVLPIMRSYVLFGKAEGAFAEKSQVTPCVGELDQTGTKWHHPFFAYLSTSNEEFFCELRHVECLPRSLAFTCSSDLVNFGQLGHFKFEISLLLFTFAQAKIAFR